MKETKKQRKRRMGMNAATALHFKTGHKQPKYLDGVKVTKGVPYVNPENFKEVI